MPEYVEREDKYDVPDNFVVPDLVTAVGGLRRKQSRYRLVNTYYDTARGALRARGLTLRRREGGSDEGWQLKIPEGVSRVELQEPLGDGTRIPDRLAEVLAGVLLGETPEPVVRMITRRTVDRILDADGEQLVEVADDRVEAENLRDDVEPQRWREVEVELGTAAPRVLRSVRKRMRSAGATVSASSSKLARVLESPARAFEGSKAAMALADYFGTQVSVILLGDVALRRGTDPIHDIRVAIRRLRSTMRIFGEFLDVPENADEELSWFAGVLGEVRDRQVQRAHFDDALAELPPELVLGAVGPDIDQTLLSEQLHARGVVTEVMSSTRYCELLELLSDWADEPPIVRDLDVARLRKAVRRAQRKADKRLAKALRSREDELLHRARKAAKRARYAAELSGPVLGKRKSKRKVKHYKRIQTELGEHQDSVVAAGTLWRLATRAGTGARGVNGFTYGLLYARERARAAAAVAAVRR